MADGRPGVLPVVEREHPDWLRGLITQFDLLRARGRMLEEERHREQVLDLRIFSAARHRPRNRDPDGGVNASTDPGARPDGS